MTHDASIDPEVEADEAAAHPMAGVATAGWSSPQADIASPSIRFAKLVLKRSGAETDIEFPINPPATVGRFDPGVGPVDVDLGDLTPEGSYISRKHARIVCGDEGAFRIQDLGSSNGTWVLRDDFERVEESDIADGQEIAFGNARFVFRITVSETPLAD